MTPARAIHMWLPFTIILLLAQMATAVTIDFKDGTNPGSVLTEFVEDGFRFTPVDSGDGINHFDLGNFFGCPDPACLDDQLELHSGNNAEEVVLDFFGEPRFSRSMFIGLVRHLRSRALEVDHRMAGRSKSFSRIVP